MKFRVNGKDNYGKERSFIVVADTEEGCKALIKSYIRLNYIAKGPTLAERIDMNFKNWEEFS